MLLQFDSFDTFTAFRKIITAASVEPVENNWFNNLTVSSCVVTVTFVKSGKNTIFSMQQMSKLF